MDFDLLDPEVDQVDGDIKGFGVISDKEGKNQCQLVRSAVDLFGSLSEDSLA